MSTIDDVVFVGAIDRLSQLWTEIVVGRLVRLYRRVNFMYWVWTR
jgi:hypothetical protein